MALSRARKRSRSIAYMRRLRVREWTKPISPASYARGVSVCLANARDLMDDAVVLLMDGRNARAVALAILALEEGDKVRQLFLLTHMGDDDARKQWEAFRLHRPKLSASLSLLTHGSFSLHQRKWAALKLKGGRGMFFAELPHLANVLKERCLYADLLRDGLWSVPARTVPRVVAAGIVGLASYLLGITSTLVFGSDMTIAGQLAPMPGQHRPVMSGLSKRGERWYTWRMSRVGQQWGARELTRHMRWVVDWEARMKRIAGSVGVDAGRE